MSGGSKTVIWLERLVALVVSLGVSFKLFSWPGASALVILGGLLFIISVALKSIRNFTDSSRNKKQKLANFSTILSGLLLATAIIFRQQHWVGAKVILIAGIGCFSLAIILTNWRLDLRKRHIVIAVVFIFWVMIGFIYNVEHEQFKKEIGIQIESLRKVSENRLDHIPDSASQKKHIVDFFKSTDKAIVQIIAQQKNISYQNAVHLYPTQIPYPAENLKNELLFFSNEFLKVSQALDSLFNEKQLSAFCQRHEYKTDTLIIKTSETSYSIPSFLISSEFDGSFIYYSWFLERLKLQVVSYFSPKYEELALGEFIHKSNKQLLAYTKGFIYRQGQLRISLIISTIFLVVSLYLDKMGLKQRYQKPIVFFAVFAFLEFVLLTADPVLQLYVDNGYLISAFEVGLAALVIPFHSMVEHNLYQKEKNDE